jgi:hypothetical protein
MTETFQQPFSDIVVFAAHHRVLLPKDSKYPWRLTKRIVGEVNGIPTSHGVLVATNGIECFIEQAGGLFRGHILWFVPDGLEDLEVLSEERASKSPSPREQRIRKQLEIY